MEERIQKPRVFLSHSSKDKLFIERLHSDFQKAMIDSWLDTIDIRHGKSWLNEIFAGGIAQVDCVLVYLTDNSINSQMVKKEIDASIIQQLKDENVGFLPYVSNGELRDQLRPDLQSLQICEWNDGNYKDLLPRIVAEIWCSFKERSMSSAVSQEKNKRLLAEKELEKIKIDRETTGIFSSSEEADFSYIADSLNRHGIWSCRLIREIVIDEKGSKKSYDEELEICDFQTDILSIFSIYVREVQGTCYDLELFVGRGIYKPPVPIDWINKTNDNKDIKIRKSSSSFNITTELLMYGLLERIVKSREANSAGVSARYFMRSSDYVIERITPKCFRFLYWLEKNGRLSRAIKWERVDNK